MGVTSLLRTSTEEVELRMRNYGGSQGEVRGGSAEDEDRRSLGEDLWDFAEEHGCDLRNFTAEARKPKCINIASWDGRYVS